MARNISGLLRGGPRRKPGVPNKATVEVKALARQLLEDPEYLEALKRRLKRGTAGPVESLLFQYGYGKPRETIEHGGGIVLRWADETDDA